MYSSSLSNLSLTVLCNDRDGGLKNNSIWWRDIIALGFDNEKSLDQFVDNIIGTLDVGRRIYFRHIASGWLINP